VKRGRVGLVCVVAIALALTGRASAQEFVPPTPTGFVNDYAGVIDPASAARMETMARNFRERTGSDVAVVTLRSLEGRPIEEVGLRIAREWGIGAGADKNGLLILLAVDDRRSRIEVSRHLEDEIPDITAGRILRASREYFAAGQYGQGLQLALETVLATIAQQQGISIEGIDQRRAYREQPRRQPGGGSASSGLVTFLFIIFLLILLMNMFGGRRRGGGCPGCIPIFLPTGGWGGGFGGGGFGGGGGGWGGGGGDWGGFGGGGDFGGGGASDSW
jgi:uncharacterized protein